MPARYETSATAVNGEKLLGAANHGGLSTTSFAVLGLLALRPWSTYELAQQMKRGLHYFWPSAESGVYQEPKKLAALGLASAESSHVGRRPRTVYSITAKGREVLREWLGRSPAPARLAHEALVKVWIGEQGTREQLVQAVRSIRHDVQDVLSHTARIAGEYLGQSPPFPERLHVNTLVLKFVADYAESAARWCDWAEEEIARWPGVTVDTGATPALEVLQAAAQSAGNGEQFPSRGAAKKAFSARGASGRPFAQRRRLRS